MMATHTATTWEGRTLTIDGDRSPGATWFRSLGERELDRAYRLAGYILGDGREAEDATQDALARAWDHRSSLRNVQSAQAWFDRILVNVCRDRLRGRGSRVRWLSLDGEAGQVVDPVASAIASDSVLRAIAALDADHRIVVVLRYWADLQLDAIADRLGVPVGTVKSRLHYALRDLRRAIGPEDADR